ncbi:histone family protein nucleoid-structuring protein H-NS [Caballeronia terrestris]|uniref:Histone family protein nucleoid-structuring protein H-NS n=1 Tax=Caballeronia terrestris TaxID=1226301 RepID=A0A158K4U2_9BURK|nr:H-NS family nucleoid-associated regulatory protein [Caballeronia terrestris]SAL75481.1 histone family protein nucleoid-structuring protein H-NS [Caballeronia terrestris]
MPTLEQIQRKMKRLQAQSEALIAMRSKTVLADIRKLMDEHGLTTADIQAHSATKKRAGRPAGAASAPTGSSSTKGKLPPKYRDPKTGATWSGHARPPAWIAKVRDRTKFLIDGAGVVAGANGVSKAKAALEKASKAARTVASKARGKGSLPPKYRDPKSGATWSGRARAPVWIAKVRDRTKFLIGEVAAAPASGVAAKKPKAKRVGAAKTATTGKKSPVKQAAKKAPVASLKRVVAKKAAKPAAKKVTKSNVASRKAVAARKTVTPSDAPVALASAAAPETGSVPATA